MLEYRFQSRSEPFQKERLSALPIFLLGFPTEDIQQSTPCQLPYCKQLQYLFIKIVAIQDDVGVHLMYFKKL